MSKRFFEGVQNGNFVEALIGDEPTPNQGTTPNNAVTVAHALQNYYNSIVTYALPNYIESNCAEITFYNNAPEGVDGGGAALGSTMIVNGISFPPSTGIAFDGKSGEMDRTKYTLSFTGPGINNGVVIRKMYV